MQMVSRQEWFRAQELPAASSYWNPTGLGQALKCRPVIQAIREIADRFLGGLSHREPVAQFLQCAVRSHGAIWCLAITALTYSTHSERRQWLTKNTEGQIRRVEMQLQIHVCGSQEACFQNVDLLIRKSTIPDPSLPRQPFPDTPPRHDWMA
jgi:hypothetical protein